MTERPPTERPSDIWTTMERPPMELPSDIWTTTERPLYFWSTVTFVPSDILTPSCNIQRFNVQPPYRVDEMSLVTSCPPQFSFFIMYFGLQDTKPPPCPLHLTKQGGSIHWSRFYLYTVYKLVLYISETITMHYIVTRTEAVYE